MESSQAPPAAQNASAMRAEARETFERRLSEAEAAVDASHALGRNHPEFSARGGVSLGQRGGAWALVGALGALVALRPEALWPATVIVVTGLFSVGVTLRLASAIAAMLRRPPPPPPHRLDALAPMITYLVPLYDEASVAPQLVMALGRLDYPTDSLDIKLLVEADDPRTIAALTAMELGAQFEIIPCPPTAPRTKPKALNYGLAFARGDIIGVLDAEDIPAPDQPRAAALAFETGPATLAVVQAPLRAHNGGASWIARQFEIEYAVHFAVWLPMVERLGWPIALGGTSNYFRRAHLTAAGGWDAWNVTEDADLGLRLARLGFDARMIAPATLEEAPVKLKHWMAQRTRWMKGHLQSWLVLMRRPGHALREMGLMKFIGAQLTIGLSLLAALAHAPMLALLAVSLASPTPLLGPLYLALLGVGYGAMLLSAIASGPVRGHLTALITLPVYLPLLSVALVRALIEMKTRPHHWSKTPHGVS